MTILSQTPVGPDESYTILATDMTKILGREELRYAFESGITETGVQGDINREQTASGHSGFEGPIGVHYELMGKKKTKKPKIKTLQVAKLVEKSEKGKNS